MRNEWLAPEPRVARGATALHEAKRIADLATHCLELEVHTWPKPGLVSDVDSGSHSDMTAITFGRSTAAIRPYLQALAEAGAAGGTMGELRAIGVRAEAAMLRATGGINTHRGAIFGLGLLCAAAGARFAGLVSDTQPLGESVAKLWGEEILHARLPAESHGQRTRRRYGAGGASIEAARGFPTVYSVGVGALRVGTALAHGDAESARVHCCMSLIAVLEDTNLLHRGGSDGLRFAQDLASGFISHGGVGQVDWLSDAVGIHRAFVSRNLSPGGAADLLAMSLFVCSMDGEQMR